MDQLTDKFKGMPTTCISDAMQGLNNMDPAIKPLKEEYVVVGRACTVKSPAGDNMAVLQGIRAAGPGDVLVIDAKGYEYRSAAGDFVIALARTIGLAGVVIDGTVRDVTGIKALNYPVFCRGITVACSEKHGVGEVNGPISCGGVSISPGDLVIGDADGVTVVPRGSEEKILQAATGKLLKDRERAEKVLVNRESAIEYIDALLGRK